MDAWDDGWVKGQEGGVGGGGVTVLCDYGGFEEGREGNRGTPAVPTCESGPRILASNHPTWDARQDIYPIPYLEDPRGGEEQEEGQRTGAGAHPACDAVDEGGLAGGREEPQRGADAVEDEGLVDGGPLWVWVVASSMRGGKGGVVCQSIYIWAIRPGPAQQKQGKVR